MTTKRTDCKRCGKTWAALDANFCYKCAMEEVAQPVDEMMMQWTISHLLLWGDPAPQNGGAPRTQYGGPAAKVVDFHHTDYPTSAKGMVVTMPSGQRFSITIVQLRDVPEREQDHKRMSDWASRLRERDRQLDERERRLREREAEGGA